MILQRYPQDTPNPEPEPKLRNFTDGDGFKLAIPIGEVVKQVDFGQMLRARTQGLVTSN